MKNKTKQKDSTNNMSVPDLKMPKKKKKLSKRNQVSYNISSESPPAVKKELIEQEKPKLIRLKKFSTCIQIENIRDLVLASLSGKKETEFFKISEKAAIERVLVVMIPKFDMIYKRMLKVAPENEGEKFDRLEKLVQRSHKITKESFDLTLLSRNPGSKFKLHSTIKSFFQPDIPPSIINDKIAKQNARTEALGRDNPMLYILNETQMLDNEYILADTYLKNKEKYPGYVLTPNDKPIIEKKIVIALDCEMCMTNSGPALTRVCLIDQKGNTIMDHLVKPLKPITDYLFKYSGINEKMLENVTMTLQDAQAEVLKHVNHNVVLVGHSLDNDLRALKMIHPFVIDTSVLYGHPKGNGYKPSLKWLAKKFLDKDIQLTNNPEDNEIIGHDPSEDAKTALELFQLKVKMGIQFGMGKCYQPFSAALKIIEEQESIKEIKTCIIDKKGVASANCLNSTFIEYESDEQNVSQISKNLDSHQFLWCRFHNLEQELQKTNDHLSEESASKVLDQLEEILKGIKSNTLSVVFNGHGTSIELSNLMKRRMGVMNENVDYNEFKRLLGLNQIPGWNEKNEKRYLELIDMVKSGMCFIGVK